jgi:hypothetical protein
MSRTAVRTAIQQYLQNANITSLGTVFSHPPKWTNETDFVGSNGSPGQGTGVVIYIHLRRQSESRMALGGATSGMKMRSYKCVLVCLLNSKKQNAEDVDADNDAFIDSLTTAIQANRNAGNPAAIFQWGEGDTLYGVDVQVDTHFPRPIRQQSMRQFSLVEVTVLEQMNT